MLSTSRERQPSVPPSARQTTERLGSTAHLARDRQASGPARPPELSRRTTLIWCRRGLDVARSAQAHRVPARGTLRRRDRRTRETDPECPRPPGCGRGTGMSTGQLLFVAARPVRRPFRHAIGRRFIAGEGQSATGSSVDASSASWTRQAPTDVRVDTASAGHHISVEQGRLHRPHARSHHRVAHCRRANIHPQLEPIGRGSRCDHNKSGHPLRGQPLAA